MFSVYLGLALAIFLVGATTGLVTIWAALAVLPAIVHTSPPDRIVAVYTLLTVGLGAAGGLLGCARLIALAGWSGHRAGLVASEQLGDVDAFFLGHGFLLAASSLVVPPFVIGVVLVNPWMSLVAAGAIYGAVRAVSMAGAIGIALRQAHRRQPPAWRWPSGVVLAALLITLVLALGPEIPRQLHAELDRAIGVYRQRLNVVEADIDRVGRQWPEVRSLMTQRIDVEQEVEMAELLAKGRGQSTQAAVLQARTRVLQARIQAQKAEADAADAMARLAREKLDVERRLRALSSIAPALN